MKAGFFLPFFMHPPLVQIQKELKNGKLSHVSLVSSFIKCIEEHNPIINAFVEVYQEEALQRAKFLDQELVAGKAGRLAGLVLAVKDNICHKGRVCSAGSEMLRNFTSLYTATALQRLLDEGAIVIGRANCDEFAMGSTNETSIYGPVINPRNHQCVAGGSSGGSAAAVAAGMCNAALGSDTGGSIRQPASFCGVIGVKPSYGSVSRYGLIAYASSLDQIGLLCNYLDDARLMLDVMSGDDEMDATLTADVLKFPEFTNHSFKYKIAYFKEALEDEGMDAEIREGLSNWVKKLVRDGHQLEAIEFPLLSSLVPVYSVIAMAEASSNLSRYSGMHFGAGVEEPGSGAITQCRSAGFGEEVKQRIMVGNFVLLSDYQGSYFEKAQRVRQKIVDELELIFQNYDALLLPVATQTACPLQYYQGDSVAMLSDDQYTVLANLSGVPAISLPLFMHSNSMPYGVQLLVNRFQDGKLLQLASALQKD